MMRKGFTLIELLIVVAIIAILAAIAVPNFLEAQMRSKVSRVKADLRSITTAVEAYAVDNNQYPNLMLYYQNHAVVDWGGGVNGCTNLTTPVQYLSSVDLRDPFYNLGPVNYIGLSIKDPSVHYSLTYLNIDKARIDNGWKKSDAPHFCMLSYGPDYKKGPNAANPSTQWYLGGYAADPPAGFTDRRFGAWQYDPTNGTVSAGDILRFQ
jgi:prepilin-type N-terminal cleavage/methylation domain-containing protein